jgi:hypothetical protein
MAALEKDTRLIMTIMYVGAMAGINVYFYSVYGAELPFTAFTHAVLFSLITVGVIMMQKALFDLIVNERLEMWLLNRKIDLYWEKRQRDEQQKQRIRESMRSKNLSPYFAQPDENYNEVSEQFLATIEP